MELKGHLMTLIMRKSLPVKQDTQKIWVDILEADPTQPVKLMNTISKVSVSLFVLLALSVLSVIVLGQFLINRQPQQYIGLSILAFSAIILLVFALAAFVALSILKILRPYLDSIIIAVILLISTILAVLFIFFVLWELLLWLVSPSNLQTSTQLGDLIYKIIVH
jgi:cytochrome c biogenesis protein CcdA